MTDSFSDWATERGLVLDLDADGLYTYLETRTAYAAWQCVESSLAESRRANAYLQSELRKMLSPEMDWENGEIGVGGKFREVARNALTTTAADHKAWEDALWGEPVAVTL